MSWKGSVLLIFIKFMRRRICHLCLLFLYSAENPAKHKVIFVACEGNVLCLIASCITKTGCSAK